MRSGFVSAFVALALASGCVTVTSPRPLPPPRPVAPQPGAPPVQRAADLPIPTTAPLVDERYVQWTLPVDLLAVIPLTYFMVQPDRYYLAAPSLLLPPLIHVAYGNSESATISVLMRVAMVGGVYLAGRSAEDECNNSESFVCLPMRSILLGETAMILPIMIDSFYLAKRTRGDDNWNRLPIVPSVAPMPGGGMTFGAATQF
ncbi:MAG TPA: hypothetical protein VFV99_02735 [Kofleriaceae bacterium]|nr:hypothetical protein [Kofleriaceae bacterium]